MNMLRDAVEQDGFAIIPKVLSPRETLSLIEWLRAAPIRHTKAGARHLMANGFVAGLANDSRLLGIASEIIGAASIPFRATLFDKSSDANWLVVWHQDTALPL